MANNESACRPTGARRRGFLKNQRRKLGAGFRRERGFQKNAANGERRTGNKPANKSRKNPMRQQRLEFLKNTAATNKRGRTGFRFEIFSGNKREKRIAQFVRARMGRAGQRLERLESSREGVGFQQKKVGWNLKKKKEGKAAEEFGHACKACVHVLVFQQVRLGTCKAEELEEGASTERKELQPRGGGDRERVRLQMKKKKNKGAGRLGVAGNGLLPLSTITLLPMISCFNSSLGISDRSNRRTCASLRPSVAISSLDFAFHSCFLPLLSFKFYHHQPCI